ncbi:hypothetical protein Ga0074812_106313 [Parafrankia irregularis]|uniref:Uncharacterized protein n=1 Tax=Parafrankia irregularis TaxID=795642 RepID=A0A0S4QNK0_9ACTN|nr:MULTISPECIES: hypothetical protein [Parafrankia]MBE3202305.1 hypothetical protein [Parafrankia sp. CH37]CUU56058.1 hypothetical protein Ga0074812_106313 [Parafrankia irregularis]
METQAASLAGTWNLDLKTPVGTLAVRYHFERAADGAVRGTATGASETVPLEDITVSEGVDGALRVTWRQKVTRPMRLNLAFDVLVAGGRMTGYSRAGRLPRTTVSGTRVRP